ncbi:aspartyl protease family protein At5g10770 [Amborella trichopoda]|uniref:Peptidase A1 domain-containing protein n=1 Tax=Amborella trichopoda TaxID=13333 RepID=U5D0B4_AMBTC|nr:aspartyl protease family protein At5g10770 [Amborella trichopoda]ERN19021.1 hypothetical protein AMTR_s00061p00053330 [Amborella trichopoda]|eukprot:XP_006857554.1 aspartyl protease family protein At5g10770 [Amborella trichopoda]
MDSAFWIILSLLLSGVAPLKDINHKTCSSKFQDHRKIENSSALILDLHHVHGPCSPLNYTPPPIYETLRLDQARVHALAARILPKESKISQASAETPLKSGQSIGVGNYIIALNLGTPPKSYLMVVDTGSVLTWLQCQPCLDCHSQLGPTYNPKASSTYSTISCQSNYCTELQEATLNPSGCSALGVCEYEASYGDRSFSLGYLSRDTLTIGRSFPGFIYGCGARNVGLFGRSAGLTGLGRHPLSLVSQLAPTYGYIFSYCLPTPKSTGSLTLGPRSAGNSFYTPMYSMSSEPGLYFLHLIGINVDGQPLPVSQTVYTSSPTLLDSGTVITRLPETVYTALKMVVLKRMPYARAPAFSILDTCFKASTGALRVPEVVMVYEGPAQMRLGSRNVFIEVDKGITCLAFAGTGTTGNGVSIIGNQQQQGFDVTYDVDGKRIGFAAGPCG